MAKTKLPFIGDKDRLQGTYVLVRSPLNVPVRGGEVANQFRLMRGLTTISYLVHHGARVIVMGHISSSKETEQTESLEPVFNILKNHFTAYFSPDVISPKTTEYRDMINDGEVLLLENLRQDPREKQNDSDFAQELAQLADIYVNDAFSVGHREHASIVGVPQFIPGYAGHNFKHEFEELSKTMKPKQPALFMLGGAKFDTKMPLVEKYLGIYDHVFVGGALANDFFKAKGYEVGRSLVSDVSAESLQKLMTNEKLLLPTDVTVFSENGEVRTTTPDDVRPEEIIMDAGPKTIALLNEYITKAETVLWNGPLGNYEKGFEKETVDLAKAVANSQAYSLIGGGDTVASIEALNCQEKFGFLSTAGGAMLYFLEHGTLPAITALAGE